MTYVCTIGHGFLNSLFSNAIESGRVDIKLSIPSFTLGKSMMQPCNHIPTGVFFQI